MKTFALVALVLACVVSLSHEFCGGRELNGDLARAAVQGNEFIRSKLADKNVATFDYIRGAAFNSLRLGGFTIDMLTKLGLKEFGDDIDKQGLNNITTGRIAYYVQGVQAICKDPKSFRGHDLIKRLEDGLEEYPAVGFNHPFPYSLAVLALCNSGYGQQSYRNYTLNIKRMIQNMIKTNPVHAVDTVSMAIMALTCMYSKQPPYRKCSWWCSYRRSRTLRYLLKQTIKYQARWLKYQQRRDGSFGNSISTALAAQALSSSSKTKVYRFPRYRCYRSMRYILGKQNADGSFSSPLVATTMQVTPILIGAIPSDITNIKCPKPTAPNPKIISVCVKVEFETQPTNGTAPPNPQPVTVNVANGTNAYNITKKASELNPCYKFTTKMSSFGNFITSICGVYQEPTNKKYWMIYSDPTTLATKGIDFFKPKDGSCIIYRFKKLNFR